MSIFDIFRRKTKEAPVEDKKVEINESLNTDANIGQTKPQDIEARIKSKEEVVVEKSIDEYVVDNIDDATKAVKKTDYNDSYNVDSSIEKSVQKTKESFFTKIAKAVVGKTKVDESVLDELEHILISSDVGVNTTLKIIERVEKRVKRDKFVSTDELNKILRDEVGALLEENNSSSFNIEDVQESRPYVIMVVGVNGVGKTTTIGKLAHKFKQGGNKVVLGAADTFRAAAVDQIKIWGERVGVEVVSHGMNTDPASVAYEAVKKGKETNADVVIIDTAGRLHNKINLMNELTKIKRVMDKIIPNSPHEILLVLDASTGQNAFLQAEAFTNATEVNALALTKLDGTAKGGVVIGISDQFKIPIKYIGVGEGINDLHLFDKRSFVEGLFGKK